MELDSEVATLEAPPVLLGALSETRLSKGSLLASLLLHGLVLATILWFSGRSHLPEHPVFLVNLKGGIAATTERRAEAPPSSDEPLPAAEKPAEVPPAMVLPSQRSTAEEAQEPPAPALEASPEEPVEEAGAAAPGVTAPGPTPEAPAVWNEAQVRYQAAVAQRVREITLPWAVRSPRWLFQGWVSFHMCIDASGRLKHAPVFLEDEPGRKHMEVRASPAALRVAPPEQLTQFLQWHLEALVEDIRMALEKAQPYPTPGPDVVIPENMAFPIALNVLEPAPPPAGVGEEIAPR